jgi:hypothetical protein
MSTYLACVCACVLRFVSVRVHACLWACVSVCWRVCVSGCGSVSVRLCTFGCASRGPAVCIARPATRGWPRVILRLCHRSVARVRRRCDVDEPHDQRAMGGAIWAHVRDRRRRRHLRHRRQQRHRTLPQRRPEERRRRCGPDSGSGVLRGLLEGYSVISVAYSQGSQCAHKEYTRRARGGTRGGT